MLDSLTTDLAATEAALANDLQFADQTRRTDAAPKVLHEGRSIVIDVPKGVERGSFMAPLRNGFPIHATDRNAPVFALYNHFHELTGLALQIPGVGLSVHFNKPVSGGRFYFQLSGSTEVA